MSKVIYVDMDGVICDFLEGLFWIHNRLDLMDRYDAGTYPFDWLLEGELGGEEDIWKPIEEKGGEYFWCNLNPYEWKDSVLKLVKSTSLPWYILTHPHSMPECYSGKYKWIKEHIPYIEDSQIILAKDKFRFANSDAFLIDDNQTNCDDFREAGGNAFIFPQPWNQGRNALKHRLPLLRTALSNWLQLSEVPANA